MGHHIDNNFKKVAQHTGFPKVGRPTAYSFPQELGKPTAYSFTRQLGQPSAYSYPQQLGQPTAYSFPEQIGQPTVFLFFQSSIFNLTGEPEQCEITSIDR